MMKSLKDNEFLFSSECVSGGHPDKLCDYISDSILDACLEIDSKARVACETACKNDIIMVFGEISLNGETPNYEQIVRKAIKEIGYDDKNKGLDYNKCQILLALDTQSSEIAQSTVINKKPEEITAGDQGIMIGYATNETEQCMPMTHYYSCKIISRLQQCRNEKICTWMLPDCKVQVTLVYKKENFEIIPVKVHTILISQQHIASVSQEQIEQDLKEKVINVVIPSNMMDQNTKFCLNPSKLFTMGGPSSDAGLTGRKIIVDTYGGWGGHGGGAFSGKDCVKVDRSGAYAVRQIAKSLVKQKFCSRVMVQVAYSIGVVQPLSIHIDTYGTINKKFTEKELQEIVETEFDLRPGMLIQRLKLDQPIFKKTVIGGHFGREDQDFTWEQIVDLKKYFKI